MPAPDYAIKLGADTAEFESAMQRAASTSSALGGALSDTGRHLSSLANRMDRGDVVQAFNGVTDAIARATGAGDKFANFVGGFALSAATGGIAGAAFGAAISGLNLILDGFAASAKQAEERAKALEAALKKLAELEAAPARAAVKERAEELGVAPLLQQREQIAAARREFVEANRERVQQALDLRSFIRETGIVAEPPGLRATLDEYRAGLERFDALRRQVEEDIFFAERPPLRATTRLGPIKLGPELQDEADRQAALMEEVHALAEEERAFQRRMKALRGEAIIGPLIGEPVAEAIASVERRTVSNPALLRGSQEELKAIQEYLTAGVGAAPNSPDKQVAENTRQTVEVLRDIEGSLSDSIPLDVVQF